MVLSNDLISQFVKATKDDKKTKTESTVYGTIVESNGAKYVRFDGAAENQLTPAIMEVDAEDGHRVSVLIKDHSAIVTGNLSRPAARKETVELITETVEAQNGKISKIEADNVEISETLTAHKASMQEIEAANVKITEDLTAASANINKLETEKLSAEQADVKYANIDFANIGIAAIEKLFSDSGIIADLVMSEGHVTGKLVGVTIIGDLIEGGTVKADKLVILGTDGLYYKLNTNGVITTAEQTDYNSLNGKIITAKSITAEKVNVDDLVAFGATIGGFHITEDSIYSGAKSSVNNTTRGIYQDTDGQFAIGDANNFLKFYKDTDGTYKLAISASSIMFGDSGKSVEDAITEIQNGIDNIITNVDVVYALHTSNSTAPTDGWSTTAPVWTSGKYMWQKMVTTYGDGTTSESPATCISAASGNGIASITEQFYLSTSKTSLSDPAPVPAYTNQIPISTEADGTPYNGGQGWKTGYRLNSAGQEQTGSSYADMEITGFIPFKANDTIRAKGITVSGTGSGQYLVTYDSNHNLVKAWGMAQFATFDGSLVSFTIKTQADNALTAAVQATIAYVRFGAYIIDNDSIITINEEITEKSTQSGGDWLTTAPTWSVGTYIWTRSAITYTDGTTTYTDPVCDPSWEAVDDEIDNASKTAKNFLEYDTTNGLQIGNKTGGSWSGFRAQITAGAYNILNAAGVVLASYGEKLIELGKNATDAVIKLCGGKGQIEYVTDEDSDTNYLQVYSDRVRIKSSKMSSVYSMYTDNSTRWEKSAVNVSPNEVELYASECIDPALPEHVDGWHVTRVGIKSGRVDVETPGPVAFNCEGVYDEYGKLMSVVRGSSGIWTYSKWSDGRVELEGVYTISNLACTTALGTWYRTSVFTPNAFPFMIVNPKLVANYESDGYGAMLWATTTTTTSKPPSYYLIRPTSATIASGKIIFHVTGTWS